MVDGLALAAGRPQMVQMAEDERRQLSAKARAEDVQLQALQMGAFRSGPKHTS